MKQKHSTKLGLTRRGLFKATGAVVLGGVLASLTSRPAVGQGRVDVLMLTTNSSHFMFVPTGLWVEPGTVVRWIQESDFHSATAYHPDNFGKELRIPEGAKSWDSGVLIEVGATFEHRFEVEGVYDYYCIPHEFLGMVGRIIVGEPKGGPGTKPLEQGIPPQAQSMMPSIEEIMARKVVSFPPGVVS
ncbi:MAG: plastocyanin/azurin family copper-binding protein [Candidatus Bipolaricaulia bacterium]